ncbi:MAG: hypothetical protein IPK93_00540 [Solirubrobacterales bacterium]|nr:hypothetical protein [Solirubrobacterales bacterium]
MAEDEEDQQGEREDRQHQVVSDHPGKPGHVLPVCAGPERLEPMKMFPLFGQWNLALDRVQITVLVTVTATQGLCRRLKYKGTGKSSQ